MANLSNIVQQALLVWYFKQTIFAPPATTLFYSLHSSNPGNTGANELDASNPGYARAELDSDPNTGTNVNYSAVTVIGSGFEITNSATISWPVAANFWNGGNPIAFFGIWNASSGGTFLAAGTVSGGTGVTILAGQQPQCLANNFTMVVV